MRDRVLPSEVDRSRLWHGACVAARFRSLVPQNLYIVGVISADFKSFSKVSSGRWLQEGSRDRRTPAGKVPHMEYERMSRSPSALGAWMPVAVALRVGGASC